MSKEHCGETEHGRAWIDCPIPSYPLPIAEKLAVEWNAAAASRAAELEAEAVMQRLSAPNTLSTQTSGVKNTAEGK
ncbi:MAG: hypothetical protein ACRER4_02935 [Steroidobacteraceae bacterium]